MDDTTLISNVLGLYARAHDARDADAMADLFAEDATIEIFNAAGDELTPIGTLQGRRAIHGAVGQMMLPHGRGEWSQNIISAPIITITGDVAIVDAQFMVFAIAATLEPADGWPQGTFGAQGTITPIEAGQYFPRLERRDGRWLINAMRIVHRLPMAFA